MEFFKKNFKIFGVGGLLFVIFMSVTEALGIIIVSEVTTAKVGGVVPFSLVWFVYEGLKVLLLFYVLKIFGLVTFGGDSGRGGANVSAMQRRLEQRRMEAAKRAAASSSSGSSDFSTPSLP